MKRTSFEDKECPISTTLEYVGEWWTILLLHDLFDGYTRFDQFERNLKISSGMLSRRLNTLVEAGIIERRQYQTRPPRHEYVLTDYGRSLRPVVVAIAAWGNHRLAPSERSMILVDAKTGEEVEPVVVDRKTGRQVDGPEFMFTSGPAAGEEMRARYAGSPGQASSGSAK